MSEMIRVGIGGGQPAKYQIVHLKRGAPIRSLTLTELQAADLHRQLGELLPDELLNVESFSSDLLDEEVSK